jgi:hypothetical protein
MKLDKVVPSDRKGKKWKAVFKDENGKYFNTHFGAAGMDDFTLTGDIKARDRYWKRHGKDLRTGDPTRPGFLSFFLLWNKSTLEASIKDYKRRFDM